MANKILLIFVTIFVLTTANANKCPSNPPARHNPDVDRYLGTWYLQMTGRAWHGEQNNIDCILERYDHRVDNPLLLDIAWGARFNGTTWRDSKGIITVSDTEHSQWDFYMDGTVFHSTIVATDYTNWTIEYACIESAGVTKENYMIRSRAHELTPEVLGALKSVVEGLGVNPNDFVMIRQENCE